MTSGRTPSVRIESEEDKRKRQERARLEQQKKEAEERAKREGKDAEGKAEEEAERITTTHRTASVRIESKKEEAERKFNEKISRFEEGRRRLMASWKEEKDNLPFQPSAFTTARRIDSLDEIEYPEGIKGLKAELNQNAKDGKFR